VYVPVAEMLPPLVEVTTHCGLAPFEMFAVNCTTPLVATVARDGVIAIDGARVVCTLTSALAQTLLDCSRA
jgi:hypothetical protein